LGLILVSFALAGIINHCWGQFAVFHQSARFVRGFGFTFAALETLLSRQPIVFCLLTTLITFNPSFQTHCSEVFKALFFGRESWDELWDVHNCFFC
jgi:hypothetical protein